MPVDEVRDCAVRVLLRVFEHNAYLNLALDRALRRRDITERGRRFLTQLVYGVVRHKLLCDHVLRGLVRKQALEDLPRPIHIILRMGVFQALWCNQVTFPAMVHSSVDLAKRYGHAGTARLVNAVLRHCPQTLEQVQLPSPEKDILGYLSLRWDMPRWIIEQWKQDFDLDTAAALCEASNKQAPVTLRTNLLRISTENLLTGLTRAGYPAVKTTSIPEELTVSSPIPPVRAKLFQHGACFVQDPASMLPAHLLDPQPGDHILDMCAAPGGKTCHLAERAQGKAHLVALEPISSRLAQLRDNVARLETPGIALCLGDGLYPPFTEGSFDRILIDAPCSGLGTLRRHPDLKWRMTPEQMNGMAVQQAHLLRSATQLCKNGGVIVYSVCTLSACETIEHMNTLVDDMSLEPEEGPEWLKEWKIAPGQYRTLPHRDGMDGFYLMRLRKSS